MFSYNVFKTPGDVIVSVCDREILGKCLGDSGFEVKDDFYGGNECGGEKLREVLKEATIINAVGTNAINFLVKEKIIEKNNVIMVGGVPHAQVVTL